MTGEAIVVILFVLSILGGVAFVIYWPRVVRSIAMRLQKPDPAPDPAPNVYGGGTVEQWFALQAYFRDRQAEYEARGGSAAGSNTSFGNGSNEL